MRFAGAAAAILLIGVAMFHAALAFGTPWGEAAWGGSHAGVLPAALRFASGVAVLFDLWLAAVCYGLVVRGRKRPLVLWLLAAYFALGVVLNGMSPSPVERLVWTPVTLALTGLTAALATRR